MIDFSLEKYKGSDGMNASVCGMPITIDHDNKWIIEVCYGFEWNGKEIVYPDKKG
jgi:6-phosphofructokinase